MSKKRFKTAADLIAAAEILPLAREYFVSDPLIKADKRRAGQTFTTSGLRWRDESAADNELRQIAAFVRVGKNSAGRPSTIACFAASPEVVKEAKAEFERRKREADEESARLKNKAEREAKRLEKLAHQREREECVEKILARYPRLGWQLIKKGTDKVSIADRNGNKIVSILYDDPVCRTPHWKESDVEVLQWIETGIKIEDAIQEFRAANAERVIALDAQFGALYGKQSPAWSFPGSIRTYAWGEQTNKYVGGESPERRRMLIAASHKIKLPHPNEEEFEWSEESLARLEADAAKLIETLRQKKAAAWERFWQLAQPGASLHTNDREVIDGSWNQLYYHVTKIKLDGTEVEFLGVDDAQEAARLAIENGAYFAWHHSLGEKWRDLAKKERWSKKDCGIATQLLAGNSEPAWVSEYAQSQHMLFGKGTGKYYQTIVSFPTCASVAVYNESGVESLARIAEQIGIDFADSKRRLLEMVREYQKRYSY